MASPMPDPGRDALGRTWEARVPITPLGTRTSHVQPSASGLASAFDLPKLARGALGGVVLALVLVLALADGGRHFLWLSLAEASVFVLLALALARGALGGARLPIPWWCVLAAMGLAAITSVRPEASVHELLLWITYGGLTVLTAIALREPREWLIDGLLLIPGALCAIALFWFWGSRDLTSRWCSTFYWPNPFAAFLLLVLPLGLVRTMRAASARAAIGHGAASALFLTALIFTYSRGAWLAGFLALAGGAAWLRCRTRTALVRGLALACAVAIAVTLLSR